MLIPVEPESRPTLASRTSNLGCEVCILTGGLSRRMGRDKAGLRLGGRTLLATIRATACSTGLRVSVLRRDSVARCGPLGGIVSALRKSRAEAILFLACDMPFVTAEILIRLSNDFGRNPSSGLFVRSSAGVGFPFVIPKTVLPKVQDQISQGQLSLQALALALGAKAIRAPRQWLPALRNINTPAEWERALRLVH